MVKILEAYFGGKPKEFSAEFEEKSRIRPPWLKITNLSSFPKFVKVLGNDNTYHFYKHRFGGYFLPVNIGLDETKYFYKRVAAEFDSMTEFNNRQFGKFIAKKLEDNKVSKDSAILDACAGTGVQSEVLVRKGYKKMDLLDFSEEMLEQAKGKKLLQENAEFVLADLTRFYPAKKYAAVVSSMGFNYLNSREWLDVLKNSLEYLKEKGIVIIVEENKRDTPYPSGFKLVEEGPIVIEKKGGEKSAKFFFVLRKA